jgi:uncharacterized membrane protein
MSISIFTVWYFKLWGLEYVLLTGIALVGVWISKYLKRNFSICQLIFKKNLDYVFLMSLVVILMALPPTVVVKLTTLSLFYYYLVIVIYVVLTFKYLRKFRNILKK